MKISPIPSTPPAQALLTMGYDWRKASIRQPVQTPLRALEDRVEAALMWASAWGSVQGEHHKAWVIDQMVRDLLGDEYEGWVRHVCDGEDGPDTYKWDEGIAP